MQRAKVKKRVLIALALTSLVLGCTEAGEELGFNYRQEKLNNAIKSGKPVVLEVGADWCKQCIEMQPVMERLEGKYSGEVVFLVADYDSQKKLVERYRVGFLPTFIFFDSTGKRVLKLAGFLEEEKLESVISRRLLQEYTLNGSYSYSPVLSKPRAHIENGKLTVEMEIKNNITVWNNAFAVLVNGIKLEPVKTSPQRITGVENFLLTDIPAGTTLEARADLPENYSYSNLDLIIKLPVYRVEGEVCILCSKGGPPYREDIVGANITSATA